MIKFFVEKENITGSTVYIDDRDDVRHLVRVLRSKIGDRIVISDKSEWEYEAEIEEISKDEVKLRITDKQKIASEPETKVVLYQGVPKGSKMEAIIQKCVELGVDSIVPVFMERTIVTDNGSFHKKVGRWQKISDEAVKQCKRGRIPKVYGAVDFDEMLGDIAADGYSLVLLAYENEDGRTIKDALREYSERTRPKNQGEGMTEKCMTEAGSDELCFNLAKNGEDAASVKADSEHEKICDKYILKNANATDKVAIIIGPEGGFDDEEIEKAKTFFRKNEVNGSGESLIDDKADNFPTKAVKDAEGAPTAASRNGETIGSEVILRPEFEIVSLGKTILRTETAGQAALAMVMYELEL